VKGVSFPWDDVVVTLKVINIHTKQHLPSRVQVPSVWFHHWAWALGCGTSALRIRACGNRRGWADDPAPSAAHRGGGGAHAHAPQRDAGTRGGHAGLQRWVSAPRCATIEGMHSDEHSVWTATGHEPPVFLDHHGRRRRWVLAGGTLAGAAASMWLAALVAGAIGFATLPSWHAQHRDRVGRQAQTIRFDRDARRRQAEARAPSGPIRLPAVSHSGQLPLDQPS
jgi:hypothetical protein